MFSDPILSMQNENICIVILKIHLNFESESEMNVSEISGKSSVIKLSNHNLDVNVFNNM